MQTTRWSARPHYVPGLPDIDRPCTPLWNGKSPRIIHIDNRSAEIGKNEKANDSHRGDLKNCLQEFNLHAKSCHLRMDLFLEQNKAAKIKANQRLSPEGSWTRKKPFEILSDCLSDDSIGVADIERTCLDGRKIIKSKGTGILNLRRTRHYGLQPSRGNRTLFASSPGER
jgi:thiamine pyrophosphate-dependent acetolactate synthase large subunit-like protein